MLEVFLGTKTATESDSSTPWWLVCVKYFPVRSAAEILPVGAVKFCGRRHRYSFTLSAAFFESKEVNRLRRLQSIGTCVCGPGAPGSPPNSSQETLWPRACRHRPVNRPSGSSSGTELPPAVEPVVSFQEPPAMSSAHP